MKAIDPEPFRPDEFAVNGKEVYLHLPNGMGRTKLNNAFLERKLAVDLSRTRVAAVGPIVADSLRRHGAPVHVCPEQGFSLDSSRPRTPPSSITRCAAPRWRASG